MGKRAGVLGLTNRLPITNNDGVKRLLNISAVFGDRSFVFNSTAAILSLSLSLPDQTHLRRFSPLSRPSSGGLVILLGEFGDQDNLSVILDCEIPRIRNFVLSISTSKMRFLSPSSFRIMHASY